MTQYFCSKELGEKLEKLGIESQFEFWWTKDVPFGCEIPKEPEILHTYFSYGADEWFQPNLEKGDQKAFHWSDLCLPQNIKLLTEYDSPTLRKMFSEVLVSHIVNGSDWQSFVEQEVDKRLSERV